MTVRIAIVGDLDPAKHSHRELEAARSLLGSDVETTWVATDSPAMAGIAAGTTAYDGVWIAPGSPYADDAAVLSVIRFARESGLPLLGTCGGMQYAVVEFVRDVLGRPGTHAEVDGVGADNAVGALACSLVGEQRVVTPVPGTRFATLLGGASFTGVHYCSYGPTAATLSTLQQHGWVVEATAPDAPVEVLSYEPHPFFVLTLFQPQIGAIQWGRVHPILHAFVDLARRTAPVRAVALAAQQLAAEEARPRPYVHQMRGPRHRGWRPLVALVLLLVLTMLFMGAVTVPFGLAGGLPDDFETLDLSVPTQLWMNLTLAALIPASMIATRVAYGRPWGRLFSVTGRLRWGWLLQCMALVAPLWVVYLAASWVVFGQDVLPRPEAWIGLLVVTLLTTPLQAAGEEVAFRGLVVQAVGAWIRSPVAALAVSTAVSAATFVAAHGSMDVWIWIDIGSLAVAACWLAWRTGGIEAGIALHVVNNLAVTFAGILLGGLEESYVDTETTGSPVSATMSVVVMTIATALILWLAKRRGIAPAGRTTASVG
ncbi:MAG: CPBP family glutamic-type intramembrane protease [Phycicoccus sp.]|uniref:CPBP family glutamic-type intramembrane protease n=1 Tax=Phycicoccus sp. TaxID=1902410 RepID=UPI00258B221D|nr:CPBP family glutamic-type intramembrane protease [Phycicoccus sp.]MCO5301955.1 CPBP family glutamic-type intramembrane protease [Phycicoccus sp.]